VPVRRWQSDATQAHAPHAPPPRVMHELNRRGGPRAGKGDAPRRGLWRAHVRAEPARHAQDGAAQVKRALAGATVVAARLAALPQWIWIYSSHRIGRLSPLAIELARLPPPRLWKKQQSKAVGVGAAGTARKVGCRVQTSLNFSAG
jgi:hypothetical protein